MCFCYTDDMMHWVNVMLKTSFIFRNFAASWIHPGDSPEKNESEIILNYMFIWTTGKFARSFINIASYKCNLPVTITYWKFYVYSE